MQLTAAPMEQAKNKSCAEAEIRYRSDSSAMIHTASQFIPVRTHIQ
jgi:hypothetical protein